MKRAYKILLALSLFASTACQGEVQQIKSVETIREQLLDPNCTDVMVISHRADWRNHPENSILAMESAIEMGVDIIELDIRQTKDGELILMHDSTLDRTTTGEGKVKDWTLDSIKTLRLKNGCSIATIHRVPTLEEAMLTAKGRVMINLDKAYDIFPDIYEVLERTQTIDHVILKGKKSAEEVAADMSRYPEKVLYMPIISLDSSDAATQIDQWLEHSTPIAIELLFKSDSNKLPFDVCKKMRGKSKIWYNTLWSTMAGGHDDDMALEDIDGAYGYLIDSLGATMIQTDRPQLLLNYLSSRKQH